MNITQHTCTDDTIISLPSVVHHQAPCVSTPYKPTSQRQIRAWVCFRDVNEQHLTGACGSPEKPIERMTWVGCCPSVTVLKVEGIVRGEHQHQLTRSGNEAKARFKQRSTEGHVCAHKLTLFSKAPRALWLWYAPVQTSMLPSPAHGRIPADEGCLPL